MNEQEFEELAAGHALHALSAEDERRFALAADAHPEWRSHLDDARQTAAGLAAAVEPVQPPARLRSSLLDSIAQTPQGVVAEKTPEAADRTPDAADRTPDAADRTPDAADRTPVAGESAEGAARSTPERPRRGSRALFVLAACLVLLVGGGIASAVLVSQLQRPASVVALDEIRSAPDAEQATVQLESGATATAHWSGTLGEAVLVASGLQRPDAGRTYELWFLRDGQPISAGVFDTDDGSATALLDGPMHAGDTIAVTVEQSGGSPTGTPTSDPIVVIPTA
ncbi:anti-sigma factor [Microbacterium sp. ARD32]|uniref:anti-sigma factor n=1 Tax=Microbacterium sp. ARD32 TaxID=2962577 RepID=UPI002882CF1E|nr:anti-sigma factor [Microbacterium sp. ARD32]MDT0158491.1 anti-sigma factor [Microbacterium sp. ARD32]